MNAVDKTMAGAASGETALIGAAPKDSQSQAKGQKNNELHIVILALTGDWKKSNLFFFDNNVNSASIMTMPLFIIGIFKLKEHHCFC